MRKQAKKTVKNVDSHCVATNTSNTKTLSFNCTMKDNRNKEYRISLMVTGPKNVSMVNGMKVFNIAGKELQEWLSKLGYDI